MVTTHDPGSVERSEPGYSFDFCGGHPAVDFTNTVGNRGGTQDEHLRTFGDLLAWAETRAVLPRPEASKLRRWAATHVQAARREFRRALELREALYGVFAASSHGQQPPEHDLDVLNKFVVAASSGRTLGLRNGRFALESPAPSGIDVLLHPIVRAATDLLTSDDVQRLGMCADEACAWLFVDRTRSRTRRWCDMKECGNRNKVRRFRQHV
jgi:predicted RNA-binding Zn ribbon-like protein